MDSCGERAWELFPSFILNACTMIMVSVAGIKVYVLVHISEVGRDQIDHRVSTGLDQ